MIEIAHKKGLDLNVPMYMGGGEWTSGALNVSNYSYLLGTYLCWDQTSVNPSSDSKFHGKSNSEAPKMESNA